MLQSGIVKKLQKNTAEIEIMRSSSCGESCAACGLCPGQTAVVTALNDVCAKDGDFVAIEMSDKKVLGAAFLVYIVPLIMLIAGYCIGAALFRSQTGGILCGFILMAITFCIIPVIDRRIRRSYVPRIVKIITEGTAND